ncbi:hypothetical protein Syun_005874 [Stephania yunnanensis]|uniref:GUN4-like domain-containing protein n=1 Tax=Stephania yunnanensis TaxID=152371 RepID=A0AAP0PX13_9MAGN
MATSLQSLHHHHHSLLHRRTASDVPSSSSSTTLFLKPTTTNTTLSSSSSSSFQQKVSSSNFTLSSTTTPPSPALSYDLLEQHLAARDFRQADEETRRLLIALAGEPAQKRGYVFFSEVKFISDSDLEAIDGLWREYSDGKFGYSVQKKIWEKARKDFTKFFMKVGWMKKLDTEIEQYNYRSFPTEFIWELDDDTPEGHLPLTNALRGTQLLNSILTHPAFQSVEEDDEVSEGSSSGADEIKQESKKPYSKKDLFKPNYSF